jgi:hypothetical protein
MSRRQVIFRVTDAIWDALRLRGDNPNAVARLDLERYYAALAAHLVQWRGQFSPDEATFLAAVVAAWRPAPGQMRLFWAAVATYVAHDQGLAPDRVQAISAILREQSYGATLALVDALECFNRLPPSQPTTERLVAVGLAPANEGVPPRAA